MIKKTLTEKVLKNFSRVRLKKASVKIPRLKVRKRKFNKPKNRDIPMSSIINILIKTAVENAKREKKEKVVDEDNGYTLVKDGASLIANGGYGTVSKGYGIAPHTSYVDYGKLFSYLGSFRAKQPYENMAEHLGALNKVTDSESFTLIDRDTMDKGARYVKYFMVPGQDIYLTASLSLVPMAGMSSAEWEQFKLWMVLDKVTYRLKTTTI